MNHIAHMRELFGYSQESFASLLRVSPATVFGWELGEQVEYEPLKFMSELFGVPKNYINGTGIFKDWDMVLNYYEAVSYTLQKLIPDSLEMQYFDDKKLLCAWLDTRMYYPQDELQIARWFGFAVSNIEIIPPEDDEHDPEVRIQFTPDFEAVMMRQPLTDFEAMRNLPPLAHKIYSLIEQMSEDGQNKAVQYVSDLVMSCKYSKYKD